MTKAQPVRWGADRTYKVTSPAGIKAVRERIVLVASQIVAARNDERPEGVIRIYNGVRVMLNGMLEAGTEGISTSELLNLARVDAGLNDTERHEALVIVKGHMAVVRDMLSEQQDSETSSVQPARPTKSPARPRPQQRYSPLLQQLENRPLKGRGSR